MRQASSKSVKDANIELKKSLGQNFLTDVNIVEKIVNTADVKDSTVIEIGPGIGAMTEILLEQCTNVVAIEIDQRLIPILNEKFEGDNFNIINEDFLNIDIDGLKEYIKEDKVKVVANLPYYITSAIITKILLEIDFVDEIFIMVQKEVAERICAGPNSKKYNSLTVFCQTLSDVKYEFTVSKNVFNPVPKIDSAIISLKRKEFSGDIYQYEKFVQNCFTQKRKTLVNNLHQSYGYEKSELIEFLESIYYSGNIRSEQISVEEFYSMYNHFLTFFKLKQM